MHEPTYIEGLRRERGYYAFRGDLAGVKAVDEELARFDKAPKGASDDQPAKRGPGRPSRAERAGERH